jgi:hypothetical protein
LEAEFILIRPLGNLLLTTSLSALGRDVNFIYGDYPWQHVQQRAILDRAYRTFYRNREEAIDSKFPDDDTCLEYVKEQRFPGGMSPYEKCQKETKHHRIAGRTAFSCQFCGTHIYPLAGTIFEKAPHAYELGSTPCT